jgi:hypothetical protein
MPSKQNKSVQKSSSALQKLKKKVRLSPSSKAAEAVFGVNIKPHTLSTASRKKEGAKGASGVTMSKCALKYALAIAKPFHPSAKLACVPAFPAPPSHKVTGYGRFLATIGTANYGFVSVVPCLANNGLIGYSSGATYTLSTAAPMASSGSVNIGVNRLAMANLPYTVSQLTTTATNGGAAIYGRIVSVGLRVTYIGTTLNESGYYTILATPAHENVLQMANSTDNAGAFTNCMVCGITRDPCEASLFPVSTAETNYPQASGVSSYVPFLYPYSGESDSQNSSYTDVQGGYNVGSPSMIVHFTGVAGSQFLVEIIQHVEYTGRGASVSCTPTDSDQRGFEIVSAAAERIPQMKNASPDVDTLDLMKSALGEVAKAVKPIAVSVLTNIGLAMLA